MAKRRGFRRFRAFGRKAYRVGKRVGKASADPLLVIGTGLAYGAVRAPIARAIAPATNYLPFGQYNDEVALGALGWFGMKMAPHKILKEQGRTILAVESFSVGAQATSGLMGGNSSGAWSGAYG